MSDNIVTSCWVAGCGNKQYICDSIRLACTDFFPLQNIISEDPNIRGSTFVPLILGSDKTAMAVGTGNSELYPLCLSFGNVKTRSDVHIEMHLSLSDSLLFPRVSPFGFSPMKQ